MVQVTLVDVLLDQNTAWSALVLREADGPRFLALQAHAYEACEAAAAFARPPSVRPRSVEFWAGALAAPDAEVEYAFIHSLEMVTFPPIGELETFVARLVLRRGDELRELDVRPSDALPVTIYRRRPIHVSDELLASADLSFLPELAQTLGIGIEYIMRLLHPPVAPDPARQEDEAATRADYAQERSVRKLIAHSAPAAPPSSTNAVTALRDRWRARRKDALSRAAGRRSGFPIAHEGAHPDAGPMEGE